jgi:hypothetical protein
MVSGEVPPTRIVVDAQKNPHAVALGKLGGRKGGLARAKKLSKKKRKEIATKAVRARWAKASKKKQPVTLHSGT